jgi:hypothetical protein
MKVNVNSYWEKSKKRPCVYLVVKPETDIERALILSLYSVKPRVVQRIADGDILLDFYPQGERK